MLPADVRLALPCLPLGYNILKSAPARVVGLRPLSLASTPAERLAGAGPALLRWLCRNLLTVQP